jgi:hypothetical protein
MIRIRPYQPGDAALVSELFTRNTPYLRDAAFWLWIHRVWPTENSISVVAEDNGNIVGHYAILPMPLSLGSIPVRAGLGVHAFVAPEYRGKVPIFQITKKCYGLAKDAGIQMLWGFPNANYRLIQEKVEGWRCVELFNAYEKKPRTNTSPLELVPINPDNASDWLRLSDYLDRFQHSGKSEACESVPTLKGWYNRYVRHPQNDYGFHLAMQGGNEVAALVTKVYENRDTGEKVGHLVDLASAPPHDVALIATLEAWFSTRVDQLCFWPLRESFRKALESADFQATGFSTFFGIKLLDPDLEPHMSTILDTNSWELNMGMSDVF